MHPHETWAELGDLAAHAAMTHVNAFYEGVEELEVGRQVMTPVDLAERFRVPDGNVYHVDAGLMRFGPLRPAVGMAGYRAPLPGLYLSGGGTHPSAGICGIPGQLAARVVARDLRGGGLLSSARQWPREAAGKPQEKKRTGKETSNAARARGSGDLRP